MWQMHSNSIISFILILDGGHGEKIKPKNQTKKSNQKIKPKIQIKNQTAGNF